MSYFEKFIQQKDVQNANLNLWKYPLSDNEFNELKNEIQYSDINMDPRDATLYYAEWWRRCYNGGKPSKRAILESVGGNSLYNFDEHSFYKKAREGAEIIGVKWIEKENTLYFRTLLLQGGLPILHISNNETHYKNFLLAVLEIQPSSVEDFSLNADIIKHLPESSRNDFVYKNCFEIVKAILNNNSQYDNILESNDVVRKISNELRNKNKTLTRKNSKTKLQNYWLYNSTKNRISLRLGLGEKYQEEELSNILGFEVEYKNYQLFIEDQIVCEFNRMLDGKYKTNWDSNFKQEWSGETEFLNCYVLFENKDLETEKKVVKDFIQIMPNLERPSFWKLYSSDEWVLVKGNSTNSEKGLILYPEQWKSDNENRSERELYQKKIFSLEFEGEETISTEDDTITFKTNVSSFDWVILDQSPHWILKSDMVIVRDTLQLLLYDANGQKIETEKYDVFVKNDKEWQSVSKQSVLPLGCVDLKIEYNGIKAYDKIYNIGKLEGTYFKDKAAFRLINNNNFRLRINADPEIVVLENQGTYSFENNNNLKIPKSINARLSIGNERSVSIKLASPFIGVSLVDSEGNIINEQDKISYQNLYGIRLVKSLERVLVRLRNSLQDEVVISKEILIDSQPMISFKDDILRLFNLGDSMNYQNSVSVEVVADQIRKTYKISGFSHILNIDNQLQKKVNLENSNDILNLFAIPLNCPLENIDLLPLYYDHEYNEYSIPQKDFSKQFIIISSKSKEYQLMPRFVNIDENLQIVDRNDRINQYHDQLSNSRFDESIWKELLKYFEICNRENIPFSTLDQIRAIGKSSNVAIRAFFFLALHQYDIDEYIRKIVPKIEQNLGFCFHWANKEDWRNVCMNEIIPFLGNDNIDIVIQIFSKYFNENNKRILEYINGGSILAEPIRHQELTDLRRQLGERVLNELPSQHPLIQNNYEIPINDHYKVSLLIKSPIAVAESIMGINKNCLWKCDEQSEIIKKNIQYSQFIVPHFYNRVIEYMLSRKKTI